MIIFSGCNCDNINYNDRDKEIALKFVLGIYMGRTGQIYSIEKTTFDTETDKFTFLIKGDIDDEIITVIAGIRDGKMFSVDLGDGSGETPFQNGLGK